MVWASAVRDCRFPLTDPQWLENLSLKELLDFYNLLNLLAMQETYASVEPILLHWYLSYFQVDRAAFFRVQDQEIFFHLGKDRNGKNLEKFAYDKKALNKVLKTKEPLFPKEELQQTQQKRCWVLPLIRSEEVEGLLYLDCISGSTDAIRPLILTSFTVLLYKHLQHRVFPDRSLLKAPKIGEEKTFKFSYDFIIGRSPAMCRVFEALDKISEADHLPVLILGNSGTGKELVARVIHDNSPRKGKPYIAENCAAVTETLLESELFGYVAGAFTGAEKNKKGLFDVAHNGTLFLDEVGDMSLEMQKKLLRVLQDGEIRSVGSQSSHFVNVRIIAATNRNLKQLIEKGLFREDLYFRLSALIVSLPDLCERGKDIEELLEFFLQKTSKDLGQPKRTLNAELRQMLLAYPWPGNVRELENEVKRLVALGDQILTPDIASSPIKTYWKTHPHPSEKL